MSRRILSILTSFLIAGAAILFISSSAFADITYVRSNGTGLSDTTTLDIGTPGTDRLVVVFADHESSGTNLTGVTVDSKSCTLVAIADNPDGAGNHLEMWYIDEDGLGASTGTVTIAISGGNTSWAVHAHLYTEVDQSGFTDSGIDNTSVGVTTTTVTGIDVPANGLVVMGSGEGQGGLTATWTSPLVTRIQGGVADPNSASMADASGIESTQQTNKTYVCTWSGTVNRATAIVAVWNAAGVAGLADHTAGQETDKFGADSPVTGEEFFAFQLTNNTAGQITVSEVQFQLSLVTGIVQGDFANLEIYVDDNGDGIIDGSDTTGTVGGTGTVDAGVSTITFSTDFNISASATVNYILKGDVSNLVANDTVTIDLAGSNITLTLDEVSGSATSVTHTADDTVIIDDHPAGQETAKFGAKSSVSGVELFSFQLTNNSSSTATVSQVQFQLSSVTGIVQGDFANLEIYVDDNGDGTIDGSDTTGTVGGTGTVDAGVTAITFSTSFTISASTTVNYILKGDVSNLVLGDAVTIDLGAGNVTLLSGSVGGSAATSLTHTCATTRIYNFQGVTTSNHGANGYPIAIEHDSDVFPWTDSGQQNDSQYPSDAEYVNISADNTDEWATDDPSDYDEMAITFRFYIQEEINTICNVEILWNGNTDGYSSSDHSIWLRKDGFDEFGGTTTWVQLGSSLSIPQDQDTDLIRNITSDFSTYINASTGAFEFVVTTSLSSEDLRTNYVQIEVACKGDADLADHVAGQETDNLEGDLSVTGEELFAFQLTNNTASTVTVSQVQFQLSSVAGIVQGDFANLAIYVDDNGDGTIDGSDTTGTVGGTGAVDAGVSTITFSTSFTISASTSVNYILTGDLSNLDANETITIDLGTSNVTLTSANLGGLGATSVTHTADYAVNLANHTAGQESDNLEGDLSVTSEELFAFRLTNNASSTVTVSQVVFQLSSVTGIVQGDFANLEIYVDNNNSGGIGFGETTTVGGTGVVNAGVTTITFSTSFTISAGATVSYILQGDVSSLVVNDTLTIGLGTANVTLAAGSVGGTSATSATHTVDDTVILYDHSASQETDKFADNTSVTGAELFAFRLRNYTGSTVTVSQVVFQLSAVAGIVQGDFANLQIYVDDDNDGKIDAGETTTVGGSGTVNAAVSTITFSTSFTISGGAWVNYILKGDVGSLMMDDTITINLGTSDITLAAGSAGGSAVAGVTHAACPYAYCRPITIDNTKVSGSSNFTDFPVLISLSGDWLKTTTADPTNGRIQNSSGYDIIFKDSTGTTQLDHEIESYDGSASGGTLLAWVRIPTLSYNSDTVIYIHYGNSCISSSQEDITGVWDSNYVAVWHFKESSGTVYDSTSNNNDATPQGTPSHVDSKIGKAYNTTSGYFSMFSSFSLRFSSGSMFIECWVKYDDFAGGTEPAIYSWSNGDDDMFGMNDPSTPRFRLNATTLEAGTASAGTWYYFAGRYDGSDMYTYHNTSQLGSVSYTGNTSFPFGTNTIGYRSTYSSYINGIIDELRISRIDRGVDYMTTTYNNQNSPATFYDVGSEEHLIGVDLAEHAAGQEGDKFGAGASVTGAELFAFKLTNNDVGQATVSEVQFQLSSVGGIEQGDFANLEIYVDDNNDGTIDAGETTTVGGSGTVDAGVSTVTFSTAFNISASGTVNYILKGDISNLAVNDTVTIGLGTGNITLALGNVGGSAPTNVTHKRGGECTYYYWRQITIDNTKVSGSSDLTNFPALINLSGDWLKTAAADPTNGRIQSANGYDIIFKDTGGTQLDHEIESYDGSSSGGTLVAWVRIPTLSHDTDTVIYMYYGNPCISSSQENITGVWNSNYKGIWHLKETPTVDSYAYDSTSMDNDGTFQDMVSGNQVVGKMNGALEFAPTQGENILQVIAVTDTTTTSAGYTALDSMSITPGAGDYIVWFSGSIGNNVSTNETMHVSLFDNGVQIAHTEREILHEESMDGGSSFPVATHAYISGVGAGEAIDVRWKTTGGTATMHERTLVVKPVDSANVSQAIATTDYTINTGGVDELVGGMTVTPGAGDYLVYFSSSAYGDSTGAASYLSLYVNGVKVAHTERAILPESSIPGTIFPISFQALVTGVGAGETIEVWGREDSGSTYVYERTLTVEKITASDAEQATATSDTSTTSSTYTALDSMSVTPGAGDYLVWFSCSVYNEAYSGDVTENFSLFVNGTQVSHAEREILHESSLNSGAAFTVALHARVTGVGAGEAIDVRWKTTGGTAYAGPRTLVVKKDSGNPDSYVDLDSHIADYAALAIGSISIWFKYTDTSDYKILFSASCNTDDNSDLDIMYYSPDDVFMAGIREDGTNVWNCSFPANYADGSWHHYVMTVDGSGNKHYIDGSQITGAYTYGGSASTQAFFNSVTGLNTLRFGNREDLNGNQYNFDGNLDEVRISDVALSADWVQTEYNNQHDPSTFYTVENEECEYSYKRTITIQASEVSGSSDLTNFPALISLSGDWLKTTTADPTNGRIENSSGYDIIFKDSGGTQLDHEIEDYDGSASGGTFVAWVRIPTLSYDTDTVIYMYYGNTCVSSSQENVTGVWDSNYKGVWHMKETPTVDSYAYDSTSNNNDGTFEASMTSADQVSGKANGALDFEGIDDYVDAGNGASLIIYNSDFTLEAWAKLDAKGQDREVISKAGDEVTVFPIELRYDIGEDYWQFNVNDGAWKYAKYTQANPQIDTWYHLVGVRDGSTIRIYVNGVEGAVTDTLGTLTDSSAFSLFIGRLLAPSDPRYFDGQIDEVRVSNIARSADWILTELNNQNDPSNFYDIGNEEEVGDVAIAEHAAGQETDQFGGNGSVTGADLFAFKLTNSTASQVTVDAVQFQLSSVTGIVQGDFSSLDIYVDSDNDGTIEAGETTTVGGSGVVNAGVSTITFSTDFNILASTTVNYILKGNVNNLAESDTVTIDLGTSNVALTAGTVGGISPTSVTHTEDEECGYFAWRQITIDNTKVSGTSDLTNFPLLVSLSGNWLKTTTADPTNGRIRNDNGYDIIFKDTDGAQLDHEIEDYDGSASGGTLVAWVRIPTLDYNDDTVIYMYYGNPCISTSQENATGVWDSNYVGVWHLKETPTVDSNAYDSTSSNSDGTFEASMTSGDQVAGKLNGSLEFDGNDDLIDINYNTTLSQITISAWIYAYSDNNVDMRIVEKEEGTGSTEEVQFLVEDTEDNLKFARSWSSAEGAWTTPTGSITFNTWYYVAVTYDDSSTLNDPTIYIGGVSQSINEIATPSGTLDSNGERYFIGNRGGKDREFDGLIDEVRISNIIRSADWIKTEFDNQNDPSTFYSVGNEECSYSYRRSITIQAGQVSGTSDLTDFPVLISLSGDWLKTTTVDSENGRIENDYGYDIIFKDTGGTQLDHEIEDYDGSTSGGTLVAWVRIPTLSYDTDTVIYMYYGASCISSPQENAAGVWDTNYKGVWHLKETPIVDSYAYDSTSNDNDGTFQGSMTTDDQIAGKFSKSLDFDGSNDYINVPHHSSLDMTGDLTLEIWLRYDSWSEWDYIVGKGYDSNDDTNYTLQLWDSSGEYGFDYTNSSSSWGGGPAETFLISGNWYHIALTYNSSTRQYSFFLNGASDGGGTGSVVMDTTSYDFGIAGDGSGYTSACLNGVIEEARISNTLRSDGWIITSYNNQNNPSNFYNVGNEEDVVNVSLAEHAAGQETDSFGSQGSVTGAELFAFKLTNSEYNQVTVSEVQFQLSSVTGIVQGDFANFEIYVDSDNDGTIDAGETTTVGGSGVVNAGVTTITFSTDFNISASTTINYILKGDVNNLVQPDSVTIDLGTSNVTLSSGSIGGTAPTSVTHTSSAVCDYSSWRQITIDNTKVSGTSDLSDFPLLVSLSGNWLKTATADPTNGRITNSSGYDIIFKDTGGTQLDHEIEYYDGTNGTLIAWVRIPTLSYNTDTVIYIYYGNSCISTSQENITGVWDANYRGVWHLSEDPSGTAPQMEDSTSNNNHGASQGTMLTEDQVDGQVDGSLNFDGSNDYIALASTIAQTTGTYEFWMNTTSVTGELNIIANDAYHSRIYIDDGDVEVETDTDAEYFNFNLSAIPISTWTHVVFVRAGDFGDLYVDGEFFLQIETVGANTLTVGNIGGTVDEARMFPGTIDEVRISDTARSAGWIQTEYNNQNDPSSFYSIGEEGAGCSYSHRKQITIQSSQVSGTSDLSDFPFLVSLTDNGLRHIDSGGHVTNSSGYDIVFRASDELTQLDHEIEEYDSSTGTLVAWVRIPTLSYDTNTVIYVYYGNTCISTSQENATAVWDSDYVAVWHLNDDVTDEQATGTHVDSTTNHNSPQNGNYDVSAKIANGQDFDGNDFIAVANSSLINTMSVYTRSYSLWFKADSTAGGNQVIYEEGGSIHGFNIYIDTNILYCGFWSTNIPTDRWMSTAFTDTTSWHHIGFTFDSTGGVQKMYLDGVEVDSEAETGYVGSHSGAINMARSDSGSDYHDADNDALNYYFDGGIDEFRISNSTRSPGWIITSYNNQNAPSSFYNEGSEESAGTLSLSNHAVGQETDKFITESSVTGAELFAFKLTNTTDSTVTVKKVLFPLSSVTGLSQGDFANAELYVDANNDGTIGGGETTTVGGTGVVNAGVTDITFSTDFTISANTIVNYILKGDVSNLVGGDTVTIDLGTSNVTITAGHVGGSAPTSATHTSDAGCEYSSWRQITIDNTKVSGSSDLSNFPLLVSLSGDWLKTTTADTTNGRIQNASGYDIIFKDTSGTQLDHEIEDYDGTNGTLVAWVRIPTLSYDVDTVIYIYYGNPCISASQENVTGVWDSNYAAVWHLKENPSGSAPQMKNSTGDYNHATSQGSMTTNYADGKINGSLDFNGTNDYFTVPDHSSLDITTNITISAWVYYHGKNLFEQDFAKILCKPWPTLESPWHMYGFGLDDGVDGSQLGQLQISEGSTIYLVKSTSVVPKNTWTYLVGVFDGSYVRFYLNAVDENQTSASGVTINTNDEPIQIGNWTLSDENFWDGIIDEVRVSNTARSADWIQTEYNNQNDPSTFYSVGEEGTGCSYSHRRKITIQASEVSGTVDLTNFPVLINLTDNALMYIDSGGHVTNTNGYDITFRASDEITQLDHEIEEYDGTAGTVVAWVRIPTLSYNVDTVIYIYYGNPCISTSQENVTGVWDSNYKAVWHLSEDPADPSPALKDSTSNNNDGTDYGSMTSGDQIPGQIDGSLDLDGSNDYIEANDSSSLRIAGSFTVSAWINTDDLPSAGDIRCIVAKGSESDTPGENHNYHLLIENAVFTSGNALIVGYEPSTGSGDMVNAIWSTSLTTGQWYHVVGVHDAGANTLTLFVNAVQRAQDTGAWATPDTGNTPLRIGDVNVSDFLNEFNGQIDEVRISDSVRSADWIQTEYNNQSTPSNFYNDGGEETAGTVTLGNHAAGQETDNFNDQASLTGVELFAFKLTNTTESDVTVKKVLFPLSAVTGIIQGDFSNLYIYVDSDNDGTKDAGETTTVGGAGEVNSGVTTMTFSDNFTIAATTAVNYILVGDVSNLFENDTITIDLNPTDVTITAGHVTGVAPTSATHTSDTQCVFAYRRPITIQASQVSGTADHTDFSVVISLSGTWLRTSTADPTNGHVEHADGYDIIFRASDGVTQLDHEIEKYDGSATGGTLVAWVRVPTLDYNDNTVIYMLYGNPCIDSSTENVTGVWDSDFKAVWHLKEDPSGTAPQINDSTSNNNDGTTGGTMISGNQVAGKLNGSVDFDGTDDYVTMPTTGFNTSAGTVGAWINADSFPAASGVEYIFAHRQDSPTTDRIYIQLWDNNTWGTGMGDTYDLVRGSVLSIDTWYHLTITWDGSNVRGYLNGNLDFGPTSYTGLTTAREIIVMAWSTTQEWADGTLDELRLSSTARSADWIKTEYNNQNDPSTFYIIGDEECPVPTAVDLISFTATGQDENVIVEWETAQEVDNLGFNLYRSIELGGSYSKLNRRLIPGLLSSVTGQQYTYIDKDVTRSVLYFYMLEDVDLDGIRTMHGPICVDWDGDGTPDDYIEDPDDDTDTDTGEEDPEVSIPDTGFDEIESDLTDWTPSNIGGSASWVNLSSFRAYEQDKGVALEWETSYEIDNLGFHIYRELDGKYYRITPDLVPGSVFSVGEGSELPAGQSYAYWDALSKQTGRELYWLDSIELNGSRASFGPIETEISGKPLPKGRQTRFQSIADYQVSKAKAASKAHMLREALSISPIREQKSRAIFYEIVPDNRPSEPRLPPSEEQWVLSGQPGVKIYVKEDGWYRAGEPELVAAGLTSGIDPRYLQLYADGVEQCIMVTGDEDGRFDPSDAVEFYGTGLDTPFTDAHVYWLVVGSRAGRRLDTPFTDIRVGPDKGMRIPRGLRGRGGTLSFPYSVELKERTFYFAALKSGERDNFFGSVISTDPVDQLLTLPNRAPSSPRGAVLEVGLQGATDVYHQVRILLNYTDAYNVGFIGQLGGRVEIPISQDTLLEGDNVVTLTAQGGTMDISLVDYVRITYWRTYTADDDVLRFRASGGEWLSIGGFSTPGIRVVDITDPVRILNVRGKVKQDGSEYAVTIKVPGGGERTLLAFTEEKIKSPAGTAANNGSSWHEIGQGADVIIIGHSDLLESVRPLKELREQQGLSVVLVDVEDLYDEFNFGAKSPWALKDFLNRAYQYWATQPRYLILAGDTSYDPRNYLGYAEFDLMPTKFVDTEKLKTASDDWFVDFDDDELPEMAVGRLPAASAAEATAVVSKIIDYEGYAGLMNEVLLVSDRNDFHNFEQASAQIAELLPGNVTVNEIFRGRSATARDDLLDLLNQGQLLVNYFGHGSTQIWNGNILTYSDALNLTNSPNLPFFVSTTCLNGFFQDPYSESLAEGLLKAPLGGAVAVWTSSGLTDPEDQVPMNEELIQLLFSGQGLTIGEAIMGAKQVATDRDVRRTWILFGDPTLRLR